MPVPFGKLYTQALRYVGRVELGTGIILGLWGALDVADAILDVPTDEEIAELCRDVEAMKAEEEDAEPLAGEEMPF